MGHQHFAKKHFPLTAGTDLDGPLYFAKKMLLPLTARTQQLYLRMQGSASLLRTKNEYSPASWDPPWWEADLWAY